MYRSTDATSNVDEPESEKEKSSGCFRVSYGNKKPRVLVTSFQEVAIVWLKLKPNRRGDGRIGVFTTDDWRSD